jgi:hypothetical protein
MSWHWVDLNAPQYATKTPPPDYCGLVYAGRRHVLSGPPESMKTLLAWIIALNALRAGRIVVAVDFEMGPNATRELLVDLGASAEEIAAIHYIEADGPASDLEIRAVIAAGTEFVLVDSDAGAYGVSGLDDERRKDVQLFASTWIDPLWRNGITTILLDHVTKNADARGKFAIGSERKIGTADVHLGLELLKPLSRGGEGLAKIRTRRGRPAWLKRPYVAELALHSDPKTHAITWDIREPVVAVVEGDAWQPTTLMEKVSRYLERQTDPVARNRVEGAGLGKSAQHIRQAMDALVAGGFAEEIPGSKRARLLVSIKPYRSSSDLVSTSSDEVTPLRPTSSPSTEGTKTRSRSSDENAPDEVST